MKKNSYKRVFDLFVLIIAHILLLPVWLLVWVVIPVSIYLEDKGPVFYRQKRIGKEGKEFIVYKFRTMIKDAEEVGPKWTAEGDPRLTKVGKILRKTALDELPSLLSILKGEMSFVGPRALAVEEQRLLEKKIRGFDKRLQVCPGLTGLAQVYNPDDDPYLKLHYDLEYIKSMSLWLDIKLIFISIWNTVTGKWDSRKGKIFMDKN